MISNAGTEPPSKQPLCPAQTGAWTNDPRRALLWGLLTGAVIGVAGSIAGESAWTILAFSLPWALLLALVGYRRMPPRVKTDAERMSWLFHLVFRRIGRG
ncbi:MAG: hypothetical protein K8J09_02145 [Planctomycetes bacterium]|nr:hypothetical protein [Planctomycetota bacterium]MCC7397642.1 hypothetical protein [Planctomycetota bacterium]